MYRERLTITLERDLVTAIDSLIDKERLRNRSQTIEYLLKEGIGLHQLNQAFLFIDANLSTPQLNQVTQLFASTGISKIYLSIDRTLRDQTAEISQNIQNQYRELGLPVELDEVPADFGSGGALVVRKEELTTPFLLSWVAEEVPLPTSLVGAYVFHRQHQGLLTQLLHAQELEFTSTGLAIANPELISHIPAGIVDLPSTVFPQLIKESKVKGYIYSR